MSIRILIFSVVAVLLAGAAWAVQPTADELTAAHAWLSARMIDGAATPPFSFTYAGRPSSKFLRGWKLNGSGKKLDANRLQRVGTYTDPKSGLVVKCEAVEYTDYPVVEWTVYFKNTGKRDTPIIERVKTLDERIADCPLTSIAVLRYNNGGQCSREAFQPREERLEYSASVRIAPGSGRPSDPYLPYFNLEVTPGIGRMFGIGWPGQWSAEFVRDGFPGVEVGIGLDNAHFKLHPGEEIRTPMVVTQFWTGDWIRAQNIWRRWMIAHNTPRPGGKSPALMLNGFNGPLVEIAEHATEANQKQYIDNYLKAGLKLDGWWMDAGWYPLEGKNWLHACGTWEADPARFPNGLAPVANYAHSKGMKFILWFEPERAAPGSWLFKNHPEWLLGPDVTPAGPPYTWDLTPDQKLLDLGNPKALNWLTDHIDKMITDCGIDVYRQDFALFPLAIWRANDTYDRQGITEIRHCEGYMKYWDELLRRHPNLLIDNCASGGRRLDLETVRRSVAFYRNDYFSEPITQQCQMYGAALWLPYTGTGLESTDPYAFHSSMSPYLGVFWDTNKKDLDYPTLKGLMDLWRRVSDCYLGDYYPLTPYSLRNDEWLAWQFDVPETGKGIVQAFRRTDCASDSQAYKLRGLEPDAMYSLSGSDQPVRGRELMENGLTVKIDKKPGAAIIEYRKM